MIYPQNFEQKIEFNVVRELLKEKCLSSLGQGRVDEMAFSSSFTEVTTRLGETLEFMRIVQEEDFPCDYFFDVRTGLKRIAIPGMYIAEVELYDLRRSLETLGRIVRFLRGSDRGGNEEAPTPYPFLRQLAEGTSDFPQIIKEIDAILNNFGKIKDNASPELSSIRRELSNTAGSISKMLMRILHSAQSEGVVDKDAAPAMRDGRLVIPVASTLKRKIRGIIHNESATGKTVFIEPEEVVEANNRIRELEGDEQREIIRILTLFSEKLRPSIPDLLDSYEFLATIDFIRSKALLSLQFKSIKPVMENHPLIDWGAAVHPLLQLSLAKHDKRVVPLDIALEGERRILLISGPNAGGKSVCLKTAGLLQYMLQCGLPIPVHESSRAGIFDSLFIDIGDEQSIENDLSTYSSHLLNMKVMLKRCDGRSLILIDEFGSGTEPLIGGAIAQATLSKLNEAGTFGIITTHYQNLKHFAEATPGVVNGAMLYDRQLMRPLFQLQVGNPGSSFAIEIARKIGLPEEVIADAGELVGRDYIQADKYLQDIVRDKRYWESKRQHIHEREKMLEEKIARYEEQAAQVEGSRKSIIAQAKEEAARLIEESNAKIEKTIRTIVESNAQKAKTKEARGELAEYGKQMREVEKAPAPTQEEIDERINRKMEQLLGREKRKKERQNRPKGEGSSVSVKPRQEQPLAVGDYVLLKGQSSVGKILSIGDKQATVQFGTITATTAIERLQRSTAPPRPDKPQAATFLSRETQDQIYEKKLQFKQDIDVRGMRGEEAVQAVTYFIDDAVLLRVARVRILHGTGNGILRTLIRQYLATAPGVAHFQDEHVQFGGAGITVVDLE